VEISGFNPDMGGRHDGNSRFGRQIIGARRFRDLESLALIRENLPVIQDAFFFSDLCYNLNIGITLLRGGNDGFSIRSKPQANAYDFLAGFVD
jgi:hypothetical protein